MKITKTFKSILMLMALVTIALPVLPSKVMAENISTSPDIKPAGILADNKPTSTFNSPVNNSSTADHTIYSVSIRIDNVKPALYGRNLRVELWAVYPTYPTAAISIYDMFPEYKDNVNQPYYKNYVPSDSNASFAFNYIPLTSGVNELLVVIVDKATGEKYITNSTSNTTVQNRVKVTYTGAKTPLYKFWSGKSHFFTTDPSMLGNAQLMKYWTYEGVAYYVDKQSVDANSKPVHRFWSAQFRSHFFTLDDSMKNNPDLMKYWAYEGIAYYATSVGVYSSRPVYRFWNGTALSHFFTLDNSMKDDPYLKQFWAYEGIAFYGYNTTPEMGPSSK